MQVDKKQIVLLALALEGALAAVFWVWAEWRAYQDTLSPSPEHIKMGIALALLLYVLNCGIIEYIAKRVRAFHSMPDFVDAFAKPLADKLGVFSGLLVSICAGVGEELFFRGVLQNEFGLLIASALFSLLHFGTSAFRYFLVVLVYFGIGLIFGLSYWYFGSLWVPVIGHILYDFLALQYLKYLYVPRRA